jgi:hypothetical protein
MYILWHFKPVQVTFSKLIFKKHLLTFNKNFEPQIIRNASYYHWDRYLYFLFLVFLKKNGLPYSRDLSGGFASGMISLIKLLSQLW